MYGITPLEMIVQSYKFWMWNGLALYDALASTYMGDLGPLPLHPGGKDYHKKPNIVGEGSALILTKVIYPLLK